MIQGTHKDNEMYDSEEMYINYLETNFYRCK